jgi:hypothetical protein
MQLITLSSAISAHKLAVKGSADWYELENLIDDIMYGYKSYLPTKHLHKVTLSSACRFWCN